MSVKWLIALVLLSTGVSAQVEMQSNQSYSLPHFYFDALNFRSATSESRLDFYFQIPYNELQFVKEGNEFYSAYEIFLQLTDSDGNPVLSESWNEKAVAKKFDETVDPNIFSSSQRHFTVKPGSYTLQVAVTDSETKKSYMAQRAFVARDFSSEPESMSDIMLLKGSSQSEGKHVIVPNVDENVISQKKSFPVFYEIYFQKPSDSVLAVTEIFGPRNSVVYSSGEWMKGAVGANQEFASIPKDSLAMGAYRLSISLKRSSSEDAEVLAAATRFFTIHFPELPLTITDLDKAADEMLYVARSRTIDSIKSPPDIFVKEKRFIEFWQRFNPNPSSHQNPPMEVYYERVAYANAHFSRYFPGWKSDMGMIYIMFGPPNSVDRHPFEIDSKPYEVWYYYQRNRTFEFLDDTGFGDYRLLNPQWDSESPPYGPDFSPR